MKFKKALFKNKRSSIVVKNALISLVLKGFSVFFGFISISLFLKAVPSKEYGLILTITSIVSWVSFFDIGIGNGLRNKLGIAIAENNMLLGKKYVSTAYFYVTAFFSGFFVLYAACYRFINWPQILKIDTAHFANLDIYILIIIFLFVIRFVLQLIGVVLLADQKSYLNDSIMPIANVAVLLFYFVFLYFHWLNFITLLFIIVASPVIVLLGFSVYLFSTQYKSLKPSYKFVDKNLRKDLLGLGIKFFVLQITSLVIFSTSNILIARIFDLNFVTNYNIGYKYYNVTVLIFAIFITPFWGAFTNAWHQGDFHWIKGVIKKALVVNTGLLLINFVQFLLYAFVCKIWLGKVIEFDNWFIFSLVLYNFVCCYNNIFAYFLNSVGMINIQMYCAVAGGIINIPLTFWFARHTGLGLASINAANIISLLPSSVFTTIQTVKLLRSKFNAVPDSELGEVEISEAI